MACHTLFLFSILAATKTRPNRRVIALRVGGRDSGWTRNCSLSFSARIWKQSRILRMTLLQKLPKGVQKQSLRRKQRLNPPARANANLAQALPQLPRFE